MAGPHPSKNNLRAGCQLAILESHGERRDHRAGQTYELADAAMGVYGPTEIDDPDISRAIDRQVVRLINALLVALQARSGQHRPRCRGGGAGILLEIADSGVRRW